MSTTAIQVRRSTSGEEYRRQLHRDVFDYPKVPTPLYVLIAGLAMRDLRAQLDRSAYWTSNRYRHAAPSAPWPWMNFNVDPSEVQPLLQALLDDAKWPHYPQSLFGNWTRDQVDRCQMLTKCSDSELSSIFKVNVFDDARFDQHIEERIVRKDDAVDVRAYWNHLRIPPPSHVRVQAIFVEDMTLPVLQMLGTNYNVEPFFFASSVNWIPSRYQEDPQEFEDHITVVLPFVRMLRKEYLPVERADLVRTRNFTSTESHEKPLPYTEERRVMDTQAPLSLPGNEILLQDLLSLHMVRKPTGSTIISYHPSLEGTSAKRLQFLTQRTGDSVYWSNIFKRSQDPTFLLLAMLWYALYSWDEAFEVLLHYINILEHKVLQSKDIRLTRELHKLQAHLLCYQQLLRDFLRSVEFVRDTPNPAMDIPSISEAEREDSARLLYIETDNLIYEIDRLIRQREMLSDRLENAIRLTFATVKIEVTGARRKLRETTNRDAAAMKLMNYLTIVFLPATYLTNVFRMLDKEFTPYVATVLILTFFTCWLAITLQKESSFFPSNSSVVRRTFWPFYYAYDAMSERKSAFDEDDGAESFLEKVEL